MKQMLLICLAAQLFTCCHSQTANNITSANDNPDAVTSKNSGFALVELFTSQGCSSCPPADALLGKEIAAAAKAGNKLIALSFHVDYWNRLGWTDPYSQHLFTERQYGYSRKLKGDGVYTPQAIVNGELVTVGSNQNKLEGFIKQSLAEKPAATVVIKAVQQKAGVLAISYQYTGNPANLNIAVVQHAIATPVKAGENDGRTITNYNVVKSWKTIATKDGVYTETLETPEGYDTKNYSVVVYVQENSYGKIVAADIK